MKVLHVNAGLENGGGLTHIVNLLREAKHEGQAFDLLTLAQGPVARAARYYHLHTYVLGAQSRYHLSSLRRLRVFINRHHYQIVHTHGARANLYLALIHRHLKAHWCVTVHSNPYLDFTGRGLMGKVFTWLNLHALKQADCLFVVTQHFANLLIKRLHVDPQKIHVIYNGIFFHDDSEIPAKYEQQVYFNLVNVARLEKMKGQVLLLRALKQLNDSHIHLHIVGTGSQDGHLKAITRKWGLAPQVDFHGFMTHKQLKNLYRRMNLAVLTSYSESFPLVLLEASDNQVPILSTAVGDIKMMIPDAQHGFVAKVGQVESVTHQLRRALNLPPSSLEQMARREKAYVTRHFSVAQQLTSIKQVYQHLLEQ